MEYQKEKKEKGEEEIFVGIMTENFLKLMTYTKTQIQKDQRPPISIHENRTKQITTPRHIVFKVQKIKEKILKETRRKTLTM